MPFNGSGVYTPTSLPGSWNPAVAGQTASPTDWNTLLADISLALSTTMTKDGQSTPTADLKMGGFKFTNVGNAAARNQYAAVGQVQDGSFTYAADTGAADAYVITLAPAITAYAVGQTFRFLVANANLTTTPTLAVNGLTAGTIVFPGAGALTAGALPVDMAAQVIVSAVSTGTPTFQLQSVASPENIAGILTTKGDTFIRNATTIVRNPAGSNGGVMMASSAAALGVAPVSPFKSLIFGLTYANNVADATNDIDIAAGGAMDATNAYWMAGAAITKQSDVAWAVGTAAGGLDTGTVGDHDYYIWLIARSDTGVVDALFSLSSTAPTMPTNYDFKRLIGWFKRVSGAIVAFHVYEIEGGGIDHLWDSPTLDVNVTSGGLTTSRRTDAVKVPLNFSVRALLNTSIQNGTTPTVVRICCPDQTDVPPGIPNPPVAPMANLGYVTNSNDFVAQIRIRTDATGKIAARADSSVVNTYAVVTEGFTWARR